MNKKTTTNEELKAIISQESDSYYIDMDEVDFTSIIEENLVEKKKFHDKMEQGRLTVPIKLEQDREALNHLVSGFCRSLGISLYNCVNKYFTYDEIIENKITQNKDIEKYGLSLNAGMKFTKALSKIMEKMKYSHPQREKIINDYSLVLNEKSLKGILVLSVNPIDFLTMSLSDSWGSCLSPGGEYESGTMGYAVDSNTVLAFLISTSDLEALNRNEYVSKKWRKVLVVSENSESILASKGYPYDGAMLTDESIDILSTLLFEKNMVRYEYEKVFNRLSVKSYGPGYSDIGIRNQIYVYSTIEDLENKTELEDKILFKTGKSYACLHCGTEDAEAEAFACLECGNYERCDDCGDALSRGDGYYTAYGYMVCEGCMDANYAFASNDDELYHTDELVLTSEGEFVTEIYAEKNYSLCDGCSSFSRSEEVVLTEKGSFCENCEEEAEAAIPEGEKI